MLRQMARHALPGYQAGMHGRAAPWQRCGHVQRMQGSACECPLGGHGTGHTPRPMGVQAKVAPGRYMGLLSHTARKKIQKNFKSLALFIRLERCATNVPINKTAKKKK